MLSRTYSDFETGSFVPVSGPGVVSPVIGELIELAGPSLVDRIGSTGKGIGAARAARALRQARLVADQPVHGAIGSVAPVIRECLTGGGTVQIEGTQGYLLGQHAGGYPYCTSSDCTAMDFLAMAGCPPWLVPQDQFEVWVVFRTLPIRVAGNSGPLAGETSWDELGLAPEYTTVTRKVRRVGTWNAALARQAIQANGHRGRGTTVRAALTMADYLIPGLAGHSGSQNGAEDTSELDPETWDKLYQLVAARSKDLGTLVRLVGTGPSAVIDLREAAARHEYEHMGVRS